MAKKAEKIAELKERATRYFEECDARNENKIIKPYTVSGLIYSLGITKREFERLSAKSDYGFLSDAKMRIEAFIEENSLNGSLSSNASATSLKHNFGWGKEQIDDSEKESTHIEVTLSENAKRLAK